jgi:hypothetical protein
MLCVRKLILYMDASLSRRSPVQILHAINYYARLMIDKLLYESRNINSNIHITYNLIANPLSP